MSSLKAKNILLATVAASSIGALFWFSRNKQKLMLDDAGEAEIVTMEEAITELQALVVKYDSPSIREPLQRLEADLGSQEMEEWARKLYLAKRDQIDENSIALNNDRKVVLKLLYDLVNLWNRVQDELGTEQAGRFEDSIIEIFKLWRIGRILSFGVVMDRAQSLYAMKIDTWSRYGMHWYSKFHLSNESPYCNYDYSKDQTEAEREEWRELLEKYPGFPTMNRRLYQLLFSKKMGFQERHPDTYGRWSKPQEAEFAERPQLPVSPEHGYFLIERQHQDRLSMISPLSFGSSQPSAHSLSGNYSGDSKSVAPEGYATLVYTDVEESTSLGQALGGVYDRARNQHDDMMRRCIKQFKGYEIMTEGDAFQVAFHNAVDAVEFAMNVQEELYDENWSKALLASPHAAVDRNGKFRGLRVRMSIHTGPVDSSSSSLHGRTSYTGETCCIVEDVEKVAHGGQIVVTESTWTEFSGLEHKSSPHVVDLGKHNLRKGLHVDGDTDIALSMSLLQVLPSSLSFDYRKHYESINTLRETWNFLSGNKVICGRQFPIPRACAPPQLSPGFYDAPKSNHMEVTICFIALDMEKGKQKNEAMQEIAKHIQKNMAKKGWNGYQCKEKMLAFESISAAVRFGLDLQSDFKSLSVASFKELSGIMIGICHGKFESLCPDPHTGRADYFGTVVNQAARVAAAASPGEVYIGSMEAHPPVLERGISAAFVERIHLKGLEEDVALYQCFALAQSSHDE